MWSAIKTILLVTTVAMLIWIWAEAESLRTDQVEVRLSFVPEGNDLWVRSIDEKWDQSVQVRIEGSTAAIDDAQEILAKPLKLVLGRAGVPATAGDHPVDLREAIQQHAELKRVGVTVIGTDPASVPLRIVKLVDKQVPIRAELTGVQAEGETQISTPTITVRLPEPLAKALDALPASERTAAAVVTPDDLGDVTDEGLQAVRARIRLPASISAAEPVAISPETVIVTFRVRDTVQTLTLSSVPVWVSIPPIEGGKWDIHVVDSFITDVTASGSAELIAALKSGELRAVAFLVLSSDDLEAGIQSKRAVFAPVPASLVQAVGENGAAGDLGSDAAIQEQVPPLKFSAAKRRVSLKITGRIPTDTSPDGPAVSPPGE
ncbi:MAG: hypothetical protein H7Y88_09315 [Phycisphaerales bacterium]|nr:hypothetical protein [Phycisphaerales bacterium]